MRIFGIERDNLACNHYRILSPLSKIHELGLAEVRLVKESEIANESVINLAMTSDVLVFQRPATEAWFRFIKTMRKNGKIVVSDYDDDPFNTSPLNPFYQYVGVEEFEWQWSDGTKEMLWSENMVSAGGYKIFNIERNINHRDMFRLNFKKSDMVTCTTDILRQEFLKLNPNVVVLPNLINKNFFPEKPDFNKKEFRIGWQGGASHYEDLYMIKDVVKEVLTKHSDIKFCYFGDMRFTGLFKDSPQDQIEWHPWVNHNTYPYKLALMNLDVGLCPLVDNVFNRNKSAIKWMEYSMFDIATVASDIPPYSPVITNGQDGLLVKDDAWVDAIFDLYSNSEKRKKIARNAYENVMANHNIETKAHLWVDAYQKLMKPEPVGV